ncbi:unnamed protein product [Cyprideis torosa]|uniref:Uncharacterized protein n=1 Tax=Cyprideis torosa TaxID=163714 RepID=A0A7R8WH39_9CRUS|nr:unnamed protein product [Cyprideis torosa]CAG0893712.1 unnamed protein product [Cyprideis torosa]
MDFVCINTFRGQIMAQDKIPPELLNDGRTGLADQIGVGVKTRKEIDETNTRFGKCFTTQFVLDAINITDTDDSLSVEQIAEELSPSEFIEGAGHMLDESLEGNICLWVTGALRDWAFQYTSSCMPLDSGTSKVDLIEMIMSLFTGTRYDPSSPTITPKDPSKVIGQRSYFSTQDINQIRRLYNC